MAVENLTAKKVLDAVEKQGLTDIPIPNSPQVKKVRKILREFEERQEKSEANMKLSEI